MTRKYTAAKVRERLMKAREAWADSDNESAHIFEDDALEVYIEMKAIQGDKLAQEISAYFKEYEDKKRWYA